MCDRDQTADIRELLDAISPVRALRTRYNYSDKLQKLEPTFTILKQPELPYRTMQELAQRTSIPYETLRSWRKKILADNQWRPGLEKNKDKLIFTVEEEREIYRKVRSVIDAGGYMPVQMLQMLAIGAYRRKFRETPEQDRPKHSFSRTWCSGFLARWALSLRRAHTKRRPTIDDEKVCQFYNTMDMAFLQYVRSEVVNVDETTWRVLMNGSLTIARRGQENVECCFSADEKEAITAICAITAAGDKLPVWIVSRGTTQKCEKKFRKSPHLSRFIATGKLVVTHSENGWVNKKIACDYVNWLFGQMRENCFLLWDVFSAHRDQEVQDLARELGIGMGYIPAGLTSRHQPLDKRIFGSLKSRARARFDAAHARQEEEPSVILAVRFLLESWNAIDQDEVIKAWNDLVPIDQQVTDE